MNVWELQKSKQAARYMIGLECMVVVVMIILRMQEIYVCYMAMSIILCAVLMCVAKILKQELNCIEKNNIKRSVLKAVAQMIRAEIEKENGNCANSFAQLFCISLKGQCWKGKNNTVQRWKQKYNQ